MTIVTQNDIDKGFIMTFLCYKLHTNLWYFPLSRVNVAANAVTVPQSSTSTLNGSFLSDKQSRDPGQYTMI